MTALEACQLGLVSQVFWPTALMQEVIPRTENIASCPAKVPFTWSDAVFPQGWTVAIRFGH